MSGKCTCAEKATTASAGGQRTRGRQLHVSRPTDPREREADLLADRVMRMTAPASHGAQPCACELARHADGSAGGASISPTALDAPEGGRPLPASVRRWAVPNFGPAVDHVRVDDSPRGHASASRVGARAYTLGRDVVFGRGAYRPDTLEGRWLIAHELAHATGADGGGGGIARVPGDAPAHRPPSGLSPEDVEQIARALFQAMDGLGTDEDAIYSAFAGRNQTQVDEIGAAYARLFSRDLQADLVDELTDAELLRLGIFGAASTATTDPTADVGTLDRRLAAMVAQRLDDAMDRVGTDEASIFAALTGRTAAERTLIREEYLTLTGRELIGDLRSELSGDELVRAVRLFEQGRLEPEDEIFLAISGLGTDEDTVFRVIRSLAGNPAAIESMERRFHDKYSAIAGDLGDRIVGRRVDLIAALRDDLTTSEYEEALRVLEPILGDVAFEDCNPAAVRSEIRAFLPGAMAKVDKAIRVLEQGWDAMSAPQKAVFNRFYDPSGTGDVDAAFALQVLQNFRLIRAQFGHDLVVECEDSAGMCEGARLYYTYWSNVHVCPYFATASPSEATRKARDFVHELAHNAMMAVDRPYYDAGAGAYEGPVTPTGPAGTGIPVIGPLIRVIARSDTLYHPDAYSWFAWTI